MTIVNLIIVPCGHRNLCKARDKDCGGQSYKGNYGLLQEVHFTHQYVGSFSTWRYLFHEIHVHLKPIEPVELKNQTEIIKKNTKNKSMEMEKEERVGMRD